MGKPINDGGSPSALAQAIVDTVRELVIVLDRHLFVVAASRSFYTAFRLDPASVDGRPIYDLIDGQFRFAALQGLLDSPLAKDSIIGESEIELTLPGNLRRTFALTVRVMISDGGEPQNLLLVLEDITRRRELEREKEEFRERTEALLREKDLLMRELQHRVFNSLQIIASILLMKAETASGETRQHLQQTHQRLLAVAKVQRLIQTAGRGGLIDVDPYLKNLCESLAKSMVDRDEPVAIEVTADGSAINSGDAVSTGLIVTELVINALKHAFPKGHLNSRVCVHYESSGAGWKLVVSDNGVGGDLGQPRKDGLGLTLVGALAGQLGAQLEIANTPTGMSVSVSHGALPGGSPHAV